MNSHTTGIDNAGLTPEDLAALRQGLLEQRAFRQEQLREFDRASPARADRVAHRRAASQLEVHVKLATSARMVLADVEAALERLETGQYGGCELCRWPIPLQRLRIVPQARYCARCQQLKEVGR
ncbi:TraR/DksA family transcriptional regulator [Streptomyces sp. NPDC056721]|uniref:TraR/DksA family transcriptional regulator n=1 Tax=unclassified Streptomyces TaxID=2593676 RepID=UPI0036B8890D